MLQTTIMGGRQEPVVGYGIPWLLFSAELKADNAWWFVLVQPKEN
jgi:hypothetical protein